MNLIFLSENLKPFLTLRALSTAVKMFSWTACCRTPLACFIHSAKWSSICSLNHTQSLVEFCTRMPQGALQRRNSEYKYIRNQQENKNTSQKDEMMQNSSPVFEGDVGENHTEQSH